MILAVDVGNSRVKWGLHDGQAWHKRGWAPLADIVALGSDWAALEAPEHIVISNVAGPNVRSALDKLFSRWPCEAAWLTAQAAQCGVINRYQAPARLGSDRWAALIAAWARCAGACVVVNAGTALTVDALNDRGEFLGGLIVPGLTTMQAALAANTAGLQVASGQYADFPTRTEDAIFSGAVAAMAGAVEKMAAVLGSRQGHAPQCLISGGDAARLHARLSVAATIVDNLVLDGLIEIARV